MFPRFIWFLIASLLIIAIGTQASAAKVRLSLDTSLFHFTRDTYDFSRDGYSNKSSITTFGIGGGGVVLYDDLPQPRSLFRFGIGGVLMNRLVIGINLGLAIGYAVWKDEDDDDINDDYDFNIYGFDMMPYVSYKFGKRMVQPFVMVTFGYKGAITRFEDDEDEVFKVMTHQFAVSGGGGMHIFLARALSFDLSAMFGGDFGKYIEKEEYGNEEETEKYPLNSLRCNIFVGLSGWI